MDHPKQPLRKRWLVRFASHLRASVPSVDAEQAAALAFSRGAEILVLGPEEAADVMADLLRGVYALAKEPV